MNYLIVDSLKRYDAFYGDTFKVECPSGSGHVMRLGDVARELSRRLVSLFLPDNTGGRPCHGQEKRYTTDEHWRQLVLFYEYFDADSGRGCGARLASLKGRRGLEQKAGRKRWSSPSRPLAPVHSNLVSRLFSVPKSLGTKWGAQLLG